MDLRLVVPGSLGYSSGGNVYNARLASALAALGVRVETVEVPGAWPVGSPAERASLAAALGVPSATAHDGASPARAAASPDAVLVDGLLALGAPEEVRAAAASGPARLGILVHMSLPDAPGLTPEGRRRLAALERASLAAPDAVIVPSSFAARRLAERYGTRARVARPGVVRAPVSPGSLAAGAPPHLLCLAALLPGKRQLRIVRALAGLARLPWTATLAGHDAADPDYARAVRDEVRRLGLEDRIEVPGELRGAELDQEWARADLTLLASESETFGLVVAESLARGVPAVVPAGTGAAEALALSLEGGLGAAGTAVREEDPAAGGDPLRSETAQWLASAEVRARWRAAALAARPLLPGWDAAARAVLGALSPASAGSSGTR
ncbi:glycosyltransferase family 4 protein [Sinomonas sp. R1AF57]|uniref:glycosyltransferase family 4 protein n=1 Tax=Sinomonas sp. R1AF57 TaxID=2020377 RepID=UPI0021007C38|nr:glycosyltransferase family 4 protein [Sinomonas sp. R1AF57]